MGKRTLYRVRVEGLMYVQATTQREAMEYARSKARIADEPRHLLGVSAERATEEGARCDRWLTAPSYPDGVPVAVALEQGAGVSDD